MKKLPVILCAIGILLVGIIPSYSTSYDIPPWVKAVALFWAQDDISDQEFTEGLSFLIDQNFIKIPRMQELENKIAVLEDEITRLSNKLGKIEQQNLNYNKGELSLDKVQFNITDQGTITLVDLDLNFESELIDTVTIDVWSDSDFTGTMGTLVETGADTGIFTASLLLGDETFSTVNTNSAGTMASEINIKVQTGDEVIAQYTDTTLPELSESGEVVIVSSARIIADLNQICLGDARCITGAVTGIIDGDTIVVNGMKIRFSLASASEIDSIKGGYSRNIISAVCPVGSSAVFDEDDMQTKDSYGRLFGVVYCEGLNLNEYLLDVGAGEIRTKFCKDSEFAETEWAQKYGCEIAPQVLKSMVSEDVLIEEAICDASYPDVCIVPFPPDLDCDDIEFRNFVVAGSDRHGFDTDYDGIGCEE